jgi:hypothetical protein
MEPNIKVVNDDNQRPVINIGGLPNSSNDVTPVRNKFAIRSNSDSGSESSGESLKNTNQQSNAKFNPQYNLFANNKKMQGRKQKEEESEDDGSSEGSDDGSSEGSDDGSSEGSDDGSSQFSKDSVALSTKDNKPRLTSMQLKIKKKELLLKLHEAKKNGYQITGSYSINSDLEEMEAEYDLYEKNMGQLAMVDMFQDGLMFIIKGIELLNGRFKPGGVNMSGLSDKIYDRKDQLAHVFKRLAIKYAGGTEMPPELSLIFIIGGAMLMTHIGNTLTTSSNPLDMLSGMFGGKDTMGNIFSLMGSANKQANKVNAGDIKMKAPNADIASLISSMTNVGDIKQPKNPRDELPFRALNVPVPNEFPSSSRTRDFQADDKNSDRFSVNSSSSDSSVETRTVSIPSSKQSSNPSSNQSSNPSSNQSSKQSSVQNKVTAKQKKNSIKF